MKIRRKNLVGYVICTLVTSLVIDFNKISDGLTRAKSRNPNLDNTFNQKKKKKSTETKANESSIPNIFDFQVVPM